MHHTVKNAAAVAWHDALRDVDGHTNLPTLPTLLTHPTHVTVVAFPGGTAVPEHTVLGYSPAVDDPLSLIREKVITSVGVPFFAVIGGEPAVSNVIFLPYKKHGLLIYPTTVRGCEGGQARASECLSSPLTPARRGDTLDVKTILQSAAMLFELKDPAGMLTLLTLPLPITTSPSLPTYSDVLRSILLFSWNFLTLQSNTNGGLYGALVDGFTGDLVNADRSDVMGAMYRYAASVRDPVDELECTTFDGSASSVFGAILFGVCRVGGLAGNDLSTYLGDALEACFESDLFVTQDPLRFALKTMLPTSLSPSLSTPLVTLPVKHGGEVPILNVVKLHMPNACYVKSSSVVGLTVSDIHFVHRRSVGAGNMKAMCDDANTIMSGSNMIEICATPSRDFIDGVNQYAAVSFGYACRCWADDNKDMDIAIVAFHTTLRPRVGHEIATGAKIKPTNHVTAIRVCIPGRLSRLHEPALALSKIAFKVSEAIKAARNKLAVIFPAGNTSSLPLPPLITMSMRGPYIGRKALEAMVLIKAFQFIGGEARLTVFDDSVTPRREAADTTYCVDSVHYVGSTGIDIAPVDPSTILLAIGGKAVDYRNAYVLASDQKIVNSIKLLV